MIYIPIDDEHYHVNAFTEEERAWGRATYERVAHRYARLPLFVEKTLAPLGLQSKDRDELLLRVTLAFCHVIKVSFPPQSEAELDRTVKGWLYSFLPVIAKNLSVMRTTHPVQFEPVAATVIHISNVLQESIHSFYPSIHDFESFDEWLVLEWSALLRSIRSLLLLVTIGDDVHGMALLRDTFEILCKLTLAERFPEEYVLFKRFNLYLQMHKHGAAPIPTEMAEYLKNEPAYQRNKENFLAYGWARDKKGKRILKMSDLLHEATDSKDIGKLFQIASEFVHEDYAGVGYDYIAMRKYLVDICYFFYTETLAARDGFEFVPQKEWKSILHLLRLAFPSYAGEFPINKEALF